MNTSAMLASLLGAGFTFLACLWVVRMTRTQRWLCKQQKNVRESSKHIYVLLPVLNEVQRLPETIAYFRSTFSHCTIIIITTAKDRSGTPRLAASLARQHKNVRHLHCPTKNGKMAHQLNFAMQKIREQGIFCVYNADSRPHPRTFAAARAAIQKGAELCQQYGDYTRNIKSFPKGLRGAILLANASWQNRWARGFEISHARRKGMYMNYCIGHGLFFTRKTYEQIGGFCESTHNEDALFGLVASAKGIRIHPLPYFDMCESPDTIHGLYVQKTNWFFGPMQALTYYRLARTTVPRRRLIRLCLELATHAIYWVGGPTLMLAAFALCFSGGLSTLIVLLGVLLFLPLNNYLALQASGVRAGWREFLQLLIGSPIAYVIHGASAYRAIYLRLKSILFATRLEKPRTPMAGDHVHALG